MTPVSLPADDDRPKLAPDQLIALLGVYAGQYASYTTLLWQVPALSPNSGLQWIRPRAGERPGRARAE
jgi:hypothetical protein